MSLRGKLAGEIDDPTVAGALENFKASVDAWSEAAYSRPRTVVRTAWLAAARWRLAASWALACVLAAGSLAGALYERHHQQELARIAAVKAAEQKAAQVHAAAEKAAPAANVTKDDEDLLATVDSDVSRQVPAAMEPLAQMMDSNGTN